MTPIHKQLMTARNKARLSQRKAAGEAGITDVHLCNLEKGKGQPSIPLLVTLSRVYLCRFVIDGKVEE